MADLRLRDNAIHRAYPSCHIDDAWMRPMSSRHLRHRRHLPSQIGFSRLLQGAGALRCRNVENRCETATQAKHQTILRERGSMMTLRQIAFGLTVCTAALTLIGGTMSAAQAQSRSSAKSSKPAAAAPSPAPGGPEPTLLGQFGSWGAYTAAPGGKKICFALAKPASAKTNPPNRPRDPAYAFISTRPLEKVSNEVSIMIGYQLKSGSEGALEIGSAHYAMYTQGDGLWIKNAAEEDRLVEGLRKGSDMVVKGVSSRGTQTTDTYSLKGLSQALDRVAQECRR
jgi:hypothetical protein